MNFAKYFPILTLFFALSLTGCGESSSSSPSIDNSSSSKGEISSSSDKAPEGEAWRDSCIAIINAYRASVNATSITRNKAKEECTDSEAAADLSTNSAHGHFGSCGEFAQNSGPNITTAYYDDEVKIVKTYLDMMWDEKKLADAGDTVYMHIGHYLNMKNSQVESVACGIAYSQDGKTAWLNINFF